MGLNKAKYPGEHTQGPGMLCEAGFYSLLLQAGGNEHCNGLALLSKSFCKLFAISKGAKVPSTFHVAEHELKKNAQGIF